MADVLKNRIAAFLADFRHNRLEVTYGCKKCSVMAVDELAAARLMVLLTDYLQHPIEALESLAVAVEFEVPAIRDESDVEKRCDILLECAREARAAIASRHPQQGQ
jgi:hypothetical protein